MFNYDYYFNRTPFIKIAVQFADYLKNVEVADRSSLSIKFLFSMGT
jgi:hypothetical protein